MPDDNLYPIDAVEDSDIRRWGHAQCHALTLALHERTGWPILTLHDGRNRFGNRLLDEFGDLLHSGVVDPDGFFVDIRGRHTPDALFSVGAGPRLPVGVAEVEAVYLSDASAARWSFEMAPEPCDLVEAMDRHDLIPGAIEAAHAVIDRRLVGKVPGIGPDRLCKVEVADEAPQSNGFRPR